MMADFLSPQLDFIYFFYGLAFILLGAVCFAIGRTDHRAVWAWLGGFGLVHGATEWLDLTALILGDTPIFAWIRTGVMTLSYLLLCEFARIVARQSGFRVPGRWIYAVLLLTVVIGGWFGGNPEANAIARYAFGLTGSFATAYIFAYYAKRLAGREATLAAGTAIGFVLYGVMAGMIVPEAPIWPASVLNYAWFTDLTGLPIQLVRGLLACWMSFAIWSIWGQKLIDQMASSGYSRHLHRLFAITLVAMGSILICGWILTQYLGGMYKTSIEQESNGHMDLVRSHLDREMAMLDAMTVSLAGSPTIKSLVKGDEGGDREQAQALLDLDVELSGGHFGLVLDRNGSVLVRSTKEIMSQAELEKILASPLANRALLGYPVHQLDYEELTGSTHYNVGFPIRNAANDVIGAVILERSLDRFAQDLRGIEHPFMLVDRSGVIALSNQDDLIRKPVWPLSPSTQETALAKYGALNLPPLLKTPLTSSDWINLGGVRTFVQREPAGHSHWSIVTLTTARGIYASRVLGIVITLMTTATALVYLAGRERRIHDRLQMDRQTELEALAKDLSQQATTDPLTGLSNRLGFDRRLLLEIARAERYDNPLSLILYDIDHFKQVNDTHGHQVGDQVLVTLSGVISKRLRKTDFLARWGGEEFVILVPHGTGKHVTELANTLRRAVQAHSFPNVGDVTCSFGVAELIPGDTPASLVARADAALYEAKLNGRNRVEQVQAPRQGGAGLHRVA
ncbi:MAG: sensor domain-containing diguanylate cyclase [Methyloligella sp. ZOD6]